MQELEAIREAVFKILNGEGWKRIVHFGLKPAYTIEEKKNNVENENNRLHCAICRNLNGCCFPKDNLPKYHKHPNCHCIFEDIAKPKVTADCLREKFAGYLFSPKYANNGKAQLFIKWGYDIINIEYLIEEYIRQAEEKYASGNFQFGKLNEYGQRISIAIELWRKDRKEKVEFKSGWMVYPDGNIQLTTPYGGEVK